MEPEDEVAVGLSGGQADATVARMLLGRQLRRFREAAAVTPEQAGHEIRASRSKISRMENGRVGFKARDVADLLTLYGITSEQTRTQARELALLASARAGGRPTAVDGRMNGGRAWSRP